MGPPEVGLPAYLDESSNMLCWAEPLAGANVVAPVTMDTSLRVGAESPTRVVLRGGSVAGRGAERRRRCSGGSCMVVSAGPPMGRDRGMSSEPPTGHDKGFEKELMPPMGQIGWEVAAAGTSVADAIPS